MMLPQEIIRAKRDGETLSAGEIGDFIAALTSGAVTEGQAAAFAMAIYFRGMSLDERVALTRAMTRSGASLDWRAVNLPGPILDKHSTGGVGDNVSLMLAPMLAACGAYVPMISGRGLGHTGGTLDKLDSISGYVSQPDLPLFRPHNVVIHALAAYRRDLLHGPRRHIGEERAESFRHRRVRENGVAQAGVRQACQDGRLHRGHDLTGLGAYHHEAEDAVVARTDKRLHKAS